MITVKPRSTTPQAMATGTTAALPQVRVISSKKQQSLTRLRTDLNAKFIEAEVEARAQYLNYPYINLYGFPIDSTVTNMFSKEKTTEIKMGVFNRNNFELSVCTPAPNHPGQKEALKELNDQGYNCTIYLISDISFNKILDVYNRIVATSANDDRVLIDADKFAKFEKELTDLSSFANFFHNVTVSELIELLFAGAIKHSASDIHLEPEKDNLHMRYRLDGVLHTFAVLNKSMQSQIESRIKLLSHLKLNVDNVPQDGRLSFKIEDKEYDVRVSMLPSNYGYSIVMRLLGVGAPDLKLEGLGFNGIAKTRIETQINKPQGMIMTTGPTGSGKSTTLYAFLNQLNDGSNKIITLEDPIEYKMPGVSQTQIDAPAGYTFASGLRSILRQDPDIVMVGEIRDAETADTAVQASLTGHLVLSTLHTNDAAGAIPRLMDMNVKGFILADSLSAMIGQRLLRKLCQHCQVPDTDITAEQKARIVSELKMIGVSGLFEIPHQLHFRTCKGCDKCGGIGYKGRIGAYEVLTMVDDMRELLTNTVPSMVQIRQIAAKNGMLTMFQDGLLKALNGVTDLKELFRVVG
jgi:type IV pilus assembly protein PilB